MTTFTDRQAWVRELIGTEVPRLWCPPLTHYDTDGALDHARITAHWTFVARHIRGFLVPGSTGDGWEMSGAEIHSLLDLALRLSQKLGVILLIGVLKTETAAMVEAIGRNVDMLKKRTGLDDPIQAMKRSRVCGFTICPPRGAMLSQDQIRSGLEPVLELGVPIALYQLPQMTHNEMSPDLFVELAGRYPHVILLKDTSGKDRVAVQDKGASGVFLVRGAEGDYVKWLREGGGPYEGLLLSTANSFPAELRRMIVELQEGKIDAARAVSARLSQAVYEVFELVACVPQGNPFANANKAMDHFMAYGSDAERRDPPRLHAGTRLPVDLIRKVGEILCEINLIPARGYLDNG